MMDSFARQMVLVADDYVNDPADLEHRVKNQADRDALTDPATLAAHLSPSYRRRPHTDVIGAELAALERSWRNRQQTHELAPDDFDRLAINLPPQVGKTFTTVEWGAFWWLCLHPTHHIVIGSYGDSLAVKRGRAIRRLVVLYGHRFGLYLERGTAAVKDWALTLGATVRSVGVGAGITGNPADILFIDDPIKSRAEAEVADRREKIYDWYSADLMSRQSPGMPVVLLMTPWHPDDLRARVIDHEGRLEDGGRWRVVVMPAICSDPARDPLGRREGEPLPHPKLPNIAEVLLRHWKQVRAAVTVRDWFALWMCDPRPIEGSLLTYATLRERRCYESRERPCALPQTVAVAIDPSGGGRDAAGIVGGHLGVDGRLYWTHDRSAEMQPDAWGRVACELAVEIGADRFVIEKNYGGKMCALVVRTAWKALQQERPDEFGPFIPRVVEVTARRNKVLRAEPIAQQVIEDRIRFGGLLPELERQWATWRPGPESPGALDAAVHMAYDLLPVPVSGESKASGAVLMSQTSLMPRYG